MRNFSGRVLLLTVAGIWSICNTVLSQALYPITREEKISNSTLIVEGKVVSQQSTWNPAGTMIYTTSQVEVYKVFKGSVQKSLIEVVTLGGAADGYYIHASHLLALEKDDVGMFFCKPAGKKLQGNVPGNVFEVYSSAQGFLRYDLFSKTAAAPFVQYNDIEKELYRELKNGTGRSPDIKNSRFSLEPVKSGFQSSNSVAAPVISTFTPAVVYGGALLDPANNILTINGAGFGNSPSGSAAVQFSHVDFSPGSQFATIDYDNPLIVSWNDTQIKVRVPTQAGTGTFRVRDAAGTVVTSPTQLEVRFSVLTANFGGEYGIKQFNLGNMNNQGGYSIKYSTNTANSGINIDNSPAKATFQRALMTWREGVGVNFVEAGTSLMQVVDPDDGENLVMYDNGGTELESGPLAEGVLATSFSGVTICTNDPQNNQARKSGFDIVIRNQGYSNGNTPFTLGPCPPYAEASTVVDLESVLLHELGHALNLGHVNDPLQGAGAGTATPAKVMHYSISFNQRRISLDYSAKLGGLFQVLPKNRQYGTCAVGQTEMVPLDPVLEPKDDCPLTFPTEPLPVFSTINFDLIHAMSNKFVDPAFDQMKTDGSGTNVTNTAYYVVRTSGSGNLAMEVKNYSTSPLTIASCTPGATGIQVTGVKLSVYEVASCPAGGQYPQPILYTTFAGNGVLPSLTNVKANTNYLVVVDGIQNTKALFNVVFSGTSLPVQSTNLIGAVNGNSNDLSWTTDPSFEPTLLILERSSDGLTYQELSQFTGEASIEGQFQDVNPLPGNNYYRLKISNASGETEFSQVVLLNRAEDFSFRVFPNPVGSEMNIEIISTVPTRYTLRMVNVFGQEVLRRQFNTLGRRFVESLSTTFLMSGVYYLTLYAEDGRKIRAGAIRIQ